jgi:DNA-binding FrmR family transcriptional regulator
MKAEDSSAGVLLSDLRRAQPADKTLQNLLSILGAKLDLCGRLPVYVYDANMEGHDACAAVLHDLASAEQASFRALTECLRRHLEETAMKQAEKRRGRPTDEATPNAARTAAVAQRDQYPGGNPT